MLRGRIRTQAIADGSENLFLIRAQTLYPLDLQICAPVGYNWQGRQNSSWSYGLGAAPTSAARSMYRAFYLTTKFLLLNSHAQERKELFWTMTRSILNGPPEKDGAD